MGPRTSYGVSQMLVNSSSRYGTLVWAQSYTDSGLSKYVYTPANVPIAYSEWPTLRELSSQVLTVDK
jgi:hypothetical protein